MAGQLGSDRMTPDELKLAGQSVFGSAPGWQSRLAENMGYDRSSVSRWLSGAVPMPLHATLLMRYMLTFGAPEMAFKNGSVQSDDHEG